jgi:hypothetical protein
VDTVADLLREEGFSLQGNVKTLEGKQHPDRDAQFRYLNEQVKIYQEAGEPVVSVDTKKKELVGESANAGREWRPKGEPVEVDTHDFPDKELGKAVPYGVYDLIANTGWVNVGYDHDTAAFAVESIRRWWNGTGHADYPDATRLLITADAGGSNGYRTRAWKTELAALAAQTGLAITVCHFPPGTSKWNRIEHRLFSHITLNWRGRPLTIHEVIVQAIAATKTRTGLGVRAELDTGAYPTGVKISNATLAALPITRHGFHGDWNYTLHPESGGHTGEADPLPPTPWDTATLSDPALTGLSRPELDTLSTALEALRQERVDAHHGEHQQHRIAQGLRPHEPPGSAFNVKVARAHASSPDRPRDFEQRPGCPGGQHPAPYVAASGCPRPVRVLPRNHLGFVGRARGWWRIAGRPGARCQVSAVAVSVCLR